MRQLSVFPVLLLILSVFAPAASALDITVAPGQLQRNLRAINERLPEAVRIEGSADVRDFMVMKDFPSSLKSLDLSRLEIKGYTFGKSDYMGRRVFADNEIPPYVFFGSGIEEVQLPSGLTSIAEGAFAHSAIKRIVFPSSVRSLGDYAFYDCSSLTEMELPASLTSLGKSVFAKSPALVEADFATTGIRVLPERCFFGCSGLKSLELPGEISGIGPEALAHTSIARLDLGNLKDAGRFAFADMPLLSEVTLNSSANVGEGIFFADSALETTGSLPSDLPEASFAGASKIDLGSLLCASSTIGAYSFIGNESDTIRLSRPLELIENGAFAAMNSLKAVDATRCGNSLPRLEHGAFGDIDKSSVALLVETGTARLWKEADEWKEFDIKEASSSDVAAPEEGRTSIRLRGNVLSISSPLEIEKVEVFSVDGKILLSVSPNSTDFSTAISSEEKIIVVKAVSGGSTKIVKLSN